MKFLLPLLLILSGLGFGQENPHYCQPYAPGIYPLTPDCPNGGTRDPNQVALCRSAYDGLVQGALTQACGQYNFHKDAYDNAVNDAWAYYFQAEAAAWAFYRSIKDDLDHLLSIGFYTQAEYDFLKDQAWIDKNIMIRAAAYARDLALDDARKAFQEELDRIQEELQERPDAAAAVYRGCISNIPCEN